jgi:uncharacterized protein YuzE
MRERGISQEEVEEALRNVYAVTPADTPDRVHFWGRTAVGRRLRISRMRFTYDDEADAVYVYVLEDGTVASSEVLDDGRVIDLDEGGHLIGVEIEASERGVRLTDLIERFQLEGLRAKLRNLEDRFRRVEPA